QRGLSVGKLPGEEVARRGHRRRASIMHQHLVPGAGEDQAPGGADQAAADDCDGGHGPRQPPTSTPAHSSMVFTIEVKSLSGPCRALVMARICRTALPTIIGTPSASASSRQSRTSLCDRPVAKPKSKLGG